MSPPRVIIVEPDPSLAELFRDLFEGWTLLVVSHPSEIPNGSPPVDLVVIDEDRADGHQTRLEELPAVPIIVLGRNCRTAADEVPILLLPKPFPVALFLAFLATARENRRKPA